MSYTPVEVKMRTGMLAFAELTALVGLNIFAQQLPQGVMSAAPPIRALTVQRIATKRQHFQSGISQLSLIRTRITAWCKGASSELDALSIMAATVDFLNQFQPAGSPAPHQNKVLSERINVYPATQPPLVEGVMEIQIYNREDL